MKRRVIILIMGVLLFCGGLANATPVDVNIYSSTTIGDGNEYGTVNIYDTFPDQTIVTMTGGDIEFCNIFDTAIFSCSGGELLALSVYNDSSATINNIDYIAAAELRENGKLHIHAGGSASSISVQIFDDAELHVYGYGFEYDPSITGTNSISGFWENNEAFVILLRQPCDYDPYTQVILHYIPEPVSILSFAFGGLLLRRTRK